MEKVIYSDDKTTVKSVKGLPTIVSDKPAMVTILDSDTNVSGKIEAVTEYTVIEYTKQNGTKGNLVTIPVKLSNCRLLDRSKKDVVVNCVFDESLQKAIKEKNNATFEALFNVDLFDSKKLDKSGNPYKRNSITFVGIKN